MNAATGMRAAAIWLALGATGFGAWWLSDDDEIGTGAMRGAPQDEALTVVSYNVCFERPDAATIDAIAELDPDIVVLQETNARWEELVEEGLAARYPTRRFHHADPDGGLGLLSKLPIERLELQESPVGAFPAWCARIAGAGGPIDLLAVHLHPPLEDDSLVKGYFTTGGKRHQEIVAHLGCFDGPPDLALGDFNEREGEATAHLETLGMHQVQSARPPSERTWRWPTSLGELSGRPDHIFVTAGWRVDAVRVPQIGASDHWPLWAALTRGPT